MIFLDSLIFQVQNWCTAVSGSKCGLGVIKAHYTYHIKMSLDYQNVKSFKKVVSLT